MTDWTRTCTTEHELRAEFAGSPSAQYRPVPIWWWSGEHLEEERLLWQVERIAELGCGGFAVTGLAPNGDACGSDADSPPLASEEWLRLYRRVCERAQELGLGVVTWSPLQLGGPHEAYQLLQNDWSLRGEQLDADGNAQPWGFDWAEVRALDALTGPGTKAGRFLDTVQDLLGSTVVGLFEDEFPLMPVWSPDFAEEFRREKGYDAPVAALRGDVGPQTPALRWDFFDVAATRIERSYTAYLSKLAGQHGMLGGYDEMNRNGSPLMSARAYVDPFRTLAWANAPGTDQMGDARFPLSLADAEGHSRVWLEGFHSHGWGFTLAGQLRALYEWAREGANLYMPHGFYYTTKAFWWEWAPPEMGWRQPYARHYPAFAEQVGRLMAFASAGRHDPEVAVLYPTSTVWAATIGEGKWEEPAHVASALYTELFGHHDAPSRLEPERVRVPSLLADAGYDRVAVDEAGVVQSELPVILPGCVCLTTETVQRLAEQAEAGRLVIVAEPLPAWSAEVGRDDETFASHVARLLKSAVVVDTAAEAVAALPPPRAAGPKAQWRRAGDLELVLATGSGELRLRDRADRRPHSWDIRTGAVTPLPAKPDGSDLVVSIDGPIALLSLPAGEPVRRASATELDVIELPEVWACEYEEWGENRWGDYVRPASAGSPPVQRRTFAFREGDDPKWHRAPVTPEDVEQPHVDTGFVDHMRGATGRPNPMDRNLGGGWREAVATYGPRAVVNGEPAEYSERLGLEDKSFSAHIGLKGNVDPVKAELGEGGAGRIVSYGHVAEDVTTHLVIEGAGVATVSMDQTLLAGPVDLGVIAIPVELTAGWHELVIDLRPRDVEPCPIYGYTHKLRPHAAWVFAEPYSRDPLTIWGGQVAHPDYKTPSAERRFRRRVTLPEPATVRVQAWGAAEITHSVPSELEVGEHVVEFAVAAHVGTPGFRAVIELDMPSGAVRLVSNEAWETAGPDGFWEGVFPIGRTFAPPLDAGPPPVPYRHPLADVAWLEGPDAVTGQVRQRWADSPDMPLPAWFCFTAPPGAISMTMPVAGGVSAWLDGEPVRISGGLLPLTEGARVALRVRASAGHRGAACFSDFPELELGAGTIRTGVSWHRQGLDTFSGVITHRATVRVPGGGDAVLDLGEVAGTVAVRINGHHAGTLVGPPWTLPVTLVDGVSEIELEVANTLGPMTSRGNPTAFSPEDQRISGILARPRLLVGPV
jgi:hypothetical protein